MIATRIPPIFTEEQYLTFERSTNERHEYLDGEIFRMARESGDHADICVNLIGAFAIQLKGSPCRVRAIGTRVRGGPIHRFAQSLYSYPDLVVLCGEPQHLDDTRDTVLNPSVIVEVLSPSTEAFDRGTKFTRYQTWNPSLTDYLLVSQAEPQLEHYHKSDDGTWTYRRVSGLDATVTVASIGVTLQLADVYDRVTFDR